MEIYYHRSESVHKGKTIPARIETVVFFLPEVWNCVPTCLEWEDIKLDYKKLLEEKLQPKPTEDTASQIFHSDPNEESDKASTPFKYFANLYTYRFSIISFSCTVVFHTFLYSSAMLYRAHEVDGWQT